MERPPYSTGFGAYTTHLLIGCPCSLTLGWHLGMVSYHDWWVERSSCSYLLAPILMHGVYFVAWRRVPFLHEDWLSSAPYSMDLVFAHALMRWQLKHLV
jgi:hypothetical protein